jgi:hypothetical protein
MARKPLILNSSRLASRLLESRVFQAVLATKANRSSALREDRRRNGPGSGRTHSGKAGRAAARIDAKEEFELHDDKDKANTAIRSDQFGQGPRGDCPDLAQEFGRRAKLFEPGRLVLVPREDRC